MVINLNKRNNAHHWRLRFSSPWKVRILNQIPLELNHFLRVVPPEPNAQSILQVLGLPGAWRRGKPKTGDGGPRWFALPVASYLTSSFLPPAAFRRLLSASAVGPQPFSVFRLPYKNKNPNLKNGLGFKYII